MDYPTNSGNPRQLLPAYYPPDKKPPPSYPYGELPQPYNPYFQATPPPYPHGQAPTASYPHGQAPPASYPHSQAPPASHPHGQAPPASYPHGQATIMQPHDLQGAQTQAVVVGDCPACNRGVLRNKYSCCGICLAVIFFPVGVICCLLMMQHKCTHCRAVYQF